MTVTNRPVAGFERCLEVIMGGRVGPDGIQPYPASLIARTDKNKQDEYDGVALTGIANFTFEI